MVSIMAFALALLNLFLAAIGVSGGRYGVAVVNFGVFLLLAEFGFWEMNK